MGMVSFRVFRYYNRNLFQVLDFWYSFAMPDKKTWTFLSNHGHVLVYLSRNPEARVKDIAAEIGITERSTQSILLELQESGYIIKTKQGRRNTYRINPAGKFRHPSENSKSIGLLLEIFS
jgi:DNA-binding MarR family transcriptional regulator